PGTHEGVAPCGGSTCHGRLAPTGKDVRQNELITWQDTTSAAGAHSPARQGLEPTPAPENPHPPGAWPGTGCERLSWLPRRAGGLARQALPDFRRRGLRSLSWRFGRLAGQP